MKRIEVLCIPPGDVPESHLTYVVMGARYQGEWIFVRHKERVSWEMPAGHIEPGESADQAADRELYEEAGVVRSSREHICDYRVKVNDITEYGRLYGVEVEDLQPGLDHEIEELIFAHTLPMTLTYPEVQTLLFEKAKAHFQL
jgi:8-oxo-dGTP diphosphatase